MGIGPRVYMGSPKILREDQTGFWSKACLKLWLAFHVVTLVPTMCPCIYTGTSPGVPKARQNKSETSRRWRLLSHSSTETSAWGSISASRADHSSSLDSNLSEMVWWMMKYESWMMSMCGLSRVCSGVVGWLAFTSGLGDVIAFPYLLGSSLTIAACFRYFQGADEAPLFVFEDVRIIKPGSHVSSFSRVQTFGFVISPDHPKNPLIAKEMRAASVATCLVCLGEGGDIGKLTK